MTPDLYSDCNSNRTPNGDCACAENAIDAKVINGSHSTSEPEEGWLKILDNRMVGWRNTDTRCGSTESSDTIITTHVACADFMFVKGDIFFDGPLGGTTSTSSSFRRCPPTAMPRSGSRGRPLAGASKNGAGTIAFPALPPRTLQVRGSSRRSAAKFSSRLSRTRTFAPEFSIRRSLAYCTGEESHMRPRAGVESKDEAAGAPTATAP